MNGVKLLVFNENLLQLTKTKKNKIKYIIIKSHTIKTIYKLIKYLHLL